MARITPQKLLWYGLVFFIQLWTANARTLSIPIGVIHDADSELVNSAFRFRAVQFNRQQSQVRLEVKSKQLETNDPYSVKNAACSLMKRKVFAIFGVHNIDTVHMVKSITSKFHVPYLSPSMAVRTTSQQPGYQIYMRPLFTRAILDVIRHYSWHEIWYMYDSEEGLVRLNQLLDEITSGGHMIKTKMVRVRSAAEAERAVLSKRYKRFLVDMQADQTEILLNKLMKTASKEQHYFVVGLGLNELDLDVFDHGGLSITGFQIVDSNNETITKIMKRWSSKDTTNPWKKHWQNKHVKLMEYQAGLAMDSVDLVGGAFSRMLDYSPAQLEEMVARYRDVNATGIDCEADVEVPWVYGNDVMSSFKQRVFDGLSGHVSFDDSGFRKNYKLSILATTDRTGLTKVGEWSDEGELVFQSPPVTRPPRLPANHTYIVTSILTAPYLMLREGHEHLKGNDKYEGYCADLAHQIGYLLRINYRIELVEDGFYGSRDETGNWNGVVGKLVRMEADMAISPLTVTSTRETVIDFSHVFMSTGIGLMMKKWTFVPPSIFSFLLPFSYEIWLCILGAFVAVVVVAYGAGRISPYLWKLQDTSGKLVTADRISMVDSIWFTLGIFSLQKTNIRPQSISGRLVAAFAWMVALFFVCSYLSLIFSFLTKERMVAPIQTVEDLSQQTQIKYGIVSNGATSSFFRTSTISLYERMWAFMSGSSPSVFVKSSEEAVARVRQSKGHYAFLGESTTIDYINQRKPCDTVKVGRNLDSKGYGVGLPLGSRLKDRINLAILELREVGVLNQLQRKWWYDKGECGQSDYSHTRAQVTSSIRIPYFWGLIYILGVAMVLALIILVIEFMTKSAIDAKNEKISFREAFCANKRIVMTGNRGGKKEE